MLPYLVSPIGMHGDIRAEVVNLHEKFIADRLFYEQDYVKDPVLNKIKHIMSNVAILSLHFPSGYVDIKTDEKGKLVHNEF